jgi:transmembrane sensor
MDCQMETADQGDLRRAQEAAEWHIRLQCEGPACHSAFSAWIMESNRNVEAFLLVGAMSSRLKEELDQAHEIDVAALIAEADTNTVRPAERVRPKAFRNWSVGAGVATLVAGVFVWNLLSAQTYSTDIGEQLSIPLTDGSVIRLNTDSQVQVHYTRQVRDVELIKGEALFTVENDTDRRPFRVSTGTAVVHAVGTEFDVYRQPRRTFVAVVDGKVHVSASGLRDSLSAGEQASIGADGQIRKDADKNFQPARNWAQRRLDFDEATLAEVAAEFNRYNRAQIVVEGDALRNKLISGTFTADHPQTLFNFLEKRHDDIVVETTSDGVVIRTRDGS